MPRSNIGESEMTTTSAPSSSCACARTRPDGRCRLPPRLDEELDVHRKIAAALEERLDRLDVHEHLALVVGGAPRVDLAVANGRLERRVVHKSTGSTGCTS
jgi:hypothetical protein